MRPFLRYAFTVFIYAYQYDRHLHDLLFYRFCSMFRDAILHGNMPDIYPLDTRVVDPARISIACEHRESEPVDCPIVYGNRVVAVRIIRMETCLMSHVTCKCDCDRWYLSIKTIFVWSTSSVWILRIWLAMLKSYKYINDNIDLCKFNKWWMLGIYHINIIRKKCIAHTHTKFECSKIIINII